MKRFTRCSLRRPPGWTFGERVGPPGLFEALTSLLLADVLQSGVSGDAAEGDDVSHSVAADTVAAVHTARHFTRGEEARDRLLFGSIFTPPIV